jgi:hypothetical protein
MSSMSVGARELELYASNDGELYRRSGKLILKNLATRKANGTYNRSQAVKAYMNFADLAAKKYAVEFGGEWSKLFPVADRKQVAEAFVHHFETEHSLGNYNNLLPKKYQEKAPAPKRRTRR